MVPLATGAKVAKVSSSKANLFRLIAQTIGDALDAVLKMFLAEVDQETKSQISQTQLRENLFGMDRIQRLNGFEFDDDEILH